MKPNTVNCYCIIIFEFLCSLQHALCSIVFLCKACDAGRAANKWLMVNVQNVQEFSCQVLNRDVWSNSTVKLVVEEHFILWQVRKLLDSVLLLGFAVKQIFSGLAEVHQFLLRVCCVIL